MDCDPKSIGCKGGRAWKAFEFFKTTGFILESDYRYNVEERGTCRSDKYTKQGKVAKWSVLGINEDSIAAALVETGPLAAEINAKYF